MLKPEFFSTVKSGDYSRAPRALGSSPPLRSVELPKASKSLSNVYTMSLHYLLPMLLLTWNPPLRRIATRREEQAPPLPSSEHIVLPQPKTTFHFAVRRNFTPKAHHFPLAENITRRRRTSLCNRHMAIAPWGTAKRWKEPAGTAAEQKSLQRADMESALRR